MWCALESRLREALTLPLQLSYRSSFPHFSPRSFYSWRMALLAKPAKRSMVGKRGNLSWGQMRGPWCTVHNRKTPIRQRKKKKRWAEESEIFFIFILQLSKSLVFCQMPRKERSQKALERFLLRRVIRGRWTARPCFLFCSFVKFTVSRNKRARSPTRTLEIVPFPPLLRCLAQQQRYLSATLRSFHRFSLIFFKSFSLCEVTLALIVF